MSEREETSNVIELLLREPEIVRWLEPERSEETEDEDEPPRAA